MPDEPNPSWIIPDDEGVPGLAGERTDMAWSRSGLAVVACAAAIAKKTLSNLHHVSGTTVVFTGILVAGISWLVGLGWARLIARGTMEGRTAADRRMIAVTAYGTVALGTVAVVIALLPS